MNVSAKQLQHPDAVSTIQAVLTQTGLAPERMVLEVTESVLVGDADAVISRLRALKEIGLRVAVDDLGPDIHRWHT